MKNDRSIIQIDSMGKDDSGFDIILESEQCGHIFFGDSTPFVQAVVSCDDEAFTEVSFSYRIFCIAGIKGEYSKTENITLSKSAPKTVTLNTSFSKAGYSVYYVETFVKDLEGNIITKKLFSFSRVMESSGQNEDMGVNTHYFPFSVWEGHDGKQYYPPHTLAAKMGVGFLRTDVNWECTEREKGVYNISDSYENLFEHAQSHGMKVLAIFNYTNQFYDNGGTPQSDEAVEAYASFCAYFAKKFKGRINHFEIWNEYNLFGGFNPSGAPPESYAKMLIAASKAIKKVNPNAFIIGGVTCSTHTGWIRRTLDAGAYPYMDAVSIHAYCSVPAPAYPEQGQVIENVETYRNEMRKHGACDTVWHTEIGWSTNSLAVGVSREEQAVCAARLYAISKASEHPQVTFWYDFVNDGQDETEIEHKWGMLEHPTACVPYAAKESYVSMCAYSYFVAKTKFIKELSCDSRIKALEFWDEEKKTSILMLWSLDGQAEVTVSPQNGVLKIFNVFGNQTEETKNDSTVCVDESPIYIVGAAELTKVFFEEISDTQLVIKAANDSLCIQKQTSSVSVDGNFSPEKWGGKPQISLSAKDYKIINKSVPAADIKADIYLRWDNEFFYIAAEVHDKTHIQEATTGDQWHDLWSGDSVQFILDPLYGVRENQKEYNEIGMGLTSNTGETIPWRWQTPVNRSVQILRNAKCKVVRLEGRTLYESAFPWKDLLPRGAKAVEGKVFGFALCVNNADSNVDDLDGRLEFKKGIGRWDDRAGYDTEKLGSIVLS